jgi:hypothetical protein
MSLHVLASCGISSGRRGLEEIMLTALWFYNQKGSRRLFVMGTLILYYSQKIILGGKRQALISTIQAGTF